MAPNPHFPLQDKLLLLEFHGLVPGDAHGVILDSFLLPFLPFWLSQHCSWRQAGIQQGCASRPSTIGMGKPYGISGEVLVTNKCMCDLKPLNTQNALQFQHQSQSGSRLWQVKDFSGVQALILTDEQRLSWCFSPLCLVTDPHNLPCFVQQESRGNCPSSTGGSQ